MEPAIEFEDHEDPSNSWHSFILMYKDSTVVIYDPNGVPQVEKGPKRRITQMKRLTLLRPFIKILTTPRTQEVMKVKIKGDKKGKSYRGWGRSVTKIQIGGGGFFFIFYIHLTPHLPTCMVGVPICTPTRGANYVQTQRNNTNQSPLPDTPPHAYIYRMVSHPNQLSHPPKALSRATKKSSTLSRTITFPPSPSTAYCHFRLSSTPTTTSTDQVFGIFLGIRPQFSVSGIETNFHRTSFSLRFPWCPWISSPSILC